jgi:hypothetical protein
MFLIAFILFLQRKSREGIPRRGLLSNSNSWSTQYENNTTLHCKIIPGQGEFG